jgi:SAM-dependent methyltransferase
MSRPAAVAGPGLLSPLFALLRYRRAERLIPEGHRRGRLLDLGCGSWPAFLAATRFREKHGADRQATPERAPEEVELHRLELGAQRLPWPDGHFSVVTLLAVVEHLAAEPALRTLAEARRVLSPGGVVIVTVPSRQGDRLLSVLSRLRLASAHQHADHQVAYDLRRLRGLLEGAGFSPGGIELGRFELGLNLWARATRGSGA